MASPNKSKQKILKAKKTMPISSRKQMDILNKSKNVEALKTTKTGNNIPNGNLCLISGIITSKCLQSKTVDSSSDSNNNSVFPQKNTASSQNFIKPGEIVGSDTRLKNADEQMCLYQKARMEINFSSKFSTHEAKDSRNTEIHCKNQLNVSRCIIKNEKKKSLQHPPIVVDGTAQNTLDGKRNKMISSSKTNSVSKTNSSSKTNPSSKTTSSSESHGKSQNGTLSANSYLVSAEKTPNLVSSVSCSKCSSSMMRVKDLSKACRSGTSGSEHGCLHQLSSLNINSSNGPNQKKRMCSQNKENVKRMKTSEQVNEKTYVSLGRRTALLEQVKHLIREEISRINYKVLDEKLNELSERIRKTQCRSKHEAIACELFVKIGRLRRRMKDVLSSQMDCLEPSTLSSSTVCRVGIKTQNANSDSKNLDKNQEAANGPNERVTPVSSEPLQPSEKTSQRVNLSSNFVKFVSESNIADVMLISVENHNLKTPITSQPTEIRKTSRGNLHNSSNADVRVVKKNKLDFIIDLTREGLPKRNTENPSTTLMPPSNAVLSTKEITPVAKNGVEESCSFEHLPPLPEPPPLLPELADKVLDTLPPQKPELKVKRVLKPWGIALRWNIPKVNPKCAPVDSYHLFLCHESSKDKPSWKKVAEVKALPLPMACTLSQAFTASKYYFTVQPKDIFGRYGPFCDIKSLPGFSENLT